MRKLCAKGKQPWVLQPGCKECSVSRGQCSRTLGPRERPRPEAPPQRRGWRSRWSVANGWWQRRPQHGGAHQRRPRERRGAFGTSVSLGKMRVHCNELLQQTSTDSTEPLTQRKTGTRGVGGRKKNNPKHIPNHINQAENRDSTIIIPSPRTLLALRRSEWLVRQVCLDEAVLQQSSSPVEVSLVDTPLVKDLEL